jgi:hypothetical protein
MVSQQRCALHPCSWRQPPRPCSTRGPGSQWAISYRSSSHLGHPLVAAHF